MLKLLICYLFFFLLILIYKKVFFIRIAMNSIWFSEDGTISKDGIDNLIQLANDLKQSPYRRNYALFLWTDTKKIKADCKKQLRNHGIKIKDYRDAFSSDDISKQSQAWIEKSIALGNANNKLFYMIASDIFRLFLLLQYYPRQGTYSYACYFDCNDILFYNIPNPRVFRKLECLAFHFVYFDYTAYPIFKSLVQPQSRTQSLLTNDVIISNISHDNSIFKKIYATYLSNLNQIQYDGNNALETLEKTRDSMSIMDDDLMAVIVFTTTHMVNLLYTQPDTQTKITLYTFTTDKLNRERMWQVQDVEDFICFERDYTKGLTWSHRDHDCNFTISDNTKQACCRAFWYQAFTQRYKLRESS